MEVTGGADSSKFTVNTGGLLTLINLLLLSAIIQYMTVLQDDDSDNIYNVIITANAWNTSIANDSNTTNLEVNVKVIKDENGATNPIISGSTAIHFAEKQTQITSYTADRNVTWSISGGADSAKFTVSMVL